MRNKVILFIVAYISWAFLNWIPDLQHLISGVFIALLVAVMTGNLFINKPSNFKHPLRYWYFFTWYLPVFFWECFKANVDVAYRVVHPKLPINPGIVKVKTNLESDTAVTFLANSITLTPGTLTVDINQDDGYLYVHWIDVKSKDKNKATKIIVRRFEKILKKIFD